MQWLLLIFVIPYLYLLLRIYSGLVKIKPFIGEKSAELFVSVVVACHNEQRNLPVLLKSLSDQNYNPGLFEVIIVDDNSTDSTPELISHFSGIQNLLLIKNRGAGKKEAIRTGVAASRGNLILTTDADCNMGNRWIFVIASFCAEYKPDMVICPVKTESKPGFFGTFQELEFLSLQGVTAGSAIAGSPVMCNGANLAFTKEVFFRNSDKLHFEIVSGDDVFLLHSIKEDPKSKIFWLESEDVVVTTKSPETVAFFLRQRARWISKAGAYKDIYTRTLAIVTFVTILLQLSLLVAGLFDPVFLLIFLAVMVIKSIPDFLILNNTTSRYGLKSLMRVFLPAQIIYAFYIISVLIYYLINKKNHLISK
jgi:biofilm PGA synthesis N-glycosyltransferase PgaC